MEDLNPTLALILVVKRGIERGESIRSILNAKDMNFSEQLEFEIQNWKLSLDNPLIRPNFQKNVESVYRKHLYFLLERGLRGESILEPLKAMEEDVICACRIEMDEKIAKLPFLMLIPLMLFQFPALVIIILGPFLVELLESLGGQAVN